jgi:hypothetical protein
VSLREKNYMIKLVIWVFDGAVVVGGGGGFHQ